MYFGDHYLQDGYVSGPSTKVDEQLNATKEVIHSGCVLSKKLRSYKNFGVLCLNKSVKES